MRARAQEKAKAAGLSLRFLHGDAETPPFDARQFDVVISRHVVWTLPDPARALANWKRILKPGGRVIIIDGVWTPRDIPGRIRHLGVNLIRRLKGDRHHANWKKAYVQDLSQLPFFGGAEPEKINTLLQQGGFTAIRKDDMASILAFERRNGPLEYRIAYAKNRRYLFRAELKS
jgi:ubiquinone/menaquinone biosynthesis C-methylase UbiE